MIPVQSSGPKPVAIPEPPSVDPKDSKQTSTSTSSAQTAPLAKSESGGAEMKAEHSMRGAYIAANLERKINPNAPPLEYIEKGGAVARLGQSGGGVADIQRALNHGGATPALVDNGKFDAQTETAVREYQRKNGLPIDGRVGSETLKQLLKPYQQIDLMDKDSKTQLLGSAPQVNPVSMKAGNAFDVCGGAAMTNALVLSSKTPEQARANAAAVRDLAGSFSIPVTLSKEEDQALKNMEKNPPTMSAVDAQHMQQIMHRIGQRMPLANHNPQGRGLSTTQVGSAMSMLSARGAFADSNVTMHCNRQTFQNDKKEDFSTDHWTVTVDRTFANSQGTDNRSVVHEGPPSDRLKGSPGWQNELTLKNDEQPPKLILQFKQPNNKENEYHEAAVDPNNFRNPDQVRDFEKEIHKAAAKDPKTIEKKPGIVNYEWSR